MPQAHIKGSILVAVTDDLCQLVESGRLSREELEARLEARDLELLDSKIQPALWYPIDSYDRLLRLLVDVEDPGNPAELLRSRGRKAAARLAEAGLYVQLQGDSKPASLDLAQIKRTLSLWGAMVDFSRWSCVLETEQPRVFRIEVSEATRFPWVLRQANEGFLAGVFSGLAQREVRVELEDERPDRFAYRVCVGA